MNLHPVVRFAPTFGYLVMAAVWFSMILVSLFPDQALAWKVTMFFNGTMREAIYIWERAFNFSVLANFCIFMMLFFLSIYAIIKRFYMIRFLVSHAGATIFFFPLFAATNSMNSASSTFDFLPYTVRDNASLFALWVFGMIVLACLNEHILHFRRIKYLVSRRRT